MAYNTKTIVRDFQNVPAPQYYNPDTDQYEVLQGKNGAMRVLIYDAAGNPLLTAANPGIVQLAADLLTAGNPGQVAITGSVLPTGAATAAKQSTIIGHVDGLKTLLTAIKDTAGVKKIVDPLPAGTNNIGDVDIVSLPALPTGTISIGKVTLNDGTINRYVKTTVTRDQTVTTTAAEAFGGASRLATRHGVIIYAKGGDVTYGTDSAAPNKKILMGNSEYVSVRNRALYLKAAASVVAEVTEVEYEFNV